MRSKLWTVYKKHNLKMFAVYINDEDKNTKLFLVPDTTKRFTSSMLTQGWPVFDNITEVKKFLKFVEAAE